MDLNEKVFHEKAKSLKLDYEIDKFKTRGEVKLIKQFSQRE